MPDQASGPSSGGVRRRSRFPWIALAVVLVGDVGIWLLMKDEVPAVFQPRAEHNVVPEDEHWTRSAAAAAAGSAEVRTLPA